jgi:hypothetical protein
MHGDVFTCHFLEEPSASLWLVASLLLVSSCMYVYIYIYIHIYIYVYDAYICMMMLCSRIISWRHCRLVHFSRPCSHTRAHAHVDRAYIHTYKHTYIHICIHTYRASRDRRSVPLPCRRCGCRYLSCLIHTHTYIHTRTHTHIQSSPRPSLSSTPLSALPLSLPQSPHT